MLLISKERAFKMDIGFMILITVISKEGEEMEHVEI